MVMHACMGPSSAMDCYTACSRVLGSWSFVGMFLVLGQGERPSANDSMQSQQKIESIHACVHGDARAMWVARSEESNATSQGPTAPGESRGPRTKSDGHARFMHKEQSTLQEAKSQGPRTKSQGTRAKDQEPKTKTLPCMDPPPSIIYIYIYMCVVPGSQFSKFQISRFPGLRSFNFPDSLILSDKLSDPNLTPFPTHAHMHAGTTYFARSPRWHMHYKVRGPQSPWDQGPWMQEPWTKSHGLQGARTKYIPKATYLKSQGPRAKDREPRNNQCIHKRYLYRHHHSA